MKPAHKPLMVHPIKLAMLAEIGRGLETYLEPLARLMEDVKDEGIDASTQLFAVARLRNSCLRVIQQSQVTMCMVLSDFIQKVESMGGFNDSPCRPESDDTSD